jgi:proton translocating ATP synthase F1 alpha subunit
MTTKNLIIENLKNEIAHFEKDAKTEHVGTVLEVFDGIVRASGLTTIKSSEMVTFPSGVTGVALNLDESSVGIIVLGDYSKIKEGDEVKATGKILEIGVGDELIGRVVDVLGNPIDGQGAIKSTKTYPIERVASGVIERQSVDQPMQTGIKAIDALVPIGRGQRELIRPPDWKDSCRYRRYFEPEGSEHDLCLCFYRSERFKAPQARNSSQGRRRYGLHNHRFGWCV